MDTNHGGMLEHSDRGYFLSCNKLIGRTGLWLSVIAPLHLDTLVRLLDDACQLLDGDPSDGIAAHGRISALSLGQHIMDL